MFDEEREDAWLAAVRYSPNGTEVCFEMANKGTCQRMKKFGKCKYSHDPEDIRMFKAAKTLGKNKEWHSANRRDFASSRGL